MTAKAEGLERRREKVGEFEINIQSYRVGDTYHCSVDNVDPGAVIARAKGKTRQEAEEAAVKKARERVERTRIV